MDFKNLYVRTAVLTVFFTHFHLDPEYTNSYSVERAISTTCLVQGSIVEKVEIHLVFYQI